MFSRILVPTDFSEPSDAALDVARVLAGTFGASLHVLHVFESPFVAGAVSPEVFIDDSPAVQAQLLEEAKNRLQHRVTATDRAGMPPRRKSLTGPAARESIVDYATERKMDLIVMGTHGRSGRGASAHGQRRREGRAHRPVPGDDRPAGAGPTRRPGASLPEWVRRAASSSGQRAVGSGQGCAFA